MKIKKIVVIGIAILILVFVVVAIILFVVNDTSKTVKESSVNLQKNSDIVSAQISSEIEKKVYSNDEMLEQLKNGDTTNIQDILEGHELYDEEWYQGVALAAKEGEYYEWYQADINNDGFDDLVLQEFHEYKEDFKFIRAIFSVKDGQIRREFSDENDSTEIYFVAPNGNVIYYSGSHGTCDEENYSLCEFDENWVKKQVYILYLLNIYDMGEAGFNDEYMKKHWYENYPEITKEGIYSYKLIPTELEDGSKNFQKEQLTKQDFLDLFKGTLGVGFDTMLPEWYELAMKDNILWR